MNFAGKSLQGRRLKPAPTSDGYPAVNLCKAGKSSTHKLHILVADAFLPNPQGLAHVNHKDEDKFNPDVSNLERCTHQYNLEYSLAKRYELISPSGELTSVFNLSKFCRENGLSKGRLNMVDHGKTPHHKGWRKAA